MKYLIVAFLGVYFFALPSTGSKNIVIKGTIIDATTGDPVAAATIIVKNENVSTLSADDGSFSIAVSPEARFLVCRSIGYLTTEVGIPKDHKPIQIKLSKTHAKAEEVVVSGFMQLEASTPGASILRKTHRLYNDASKDADKNDFDTEDYDYINENRFRATSDNPLSTFSIDVDGASYSNVRRFLENGQLPPAGSVRIEELINYFHYDYPQPAGEDPFSINTELASCPWNKDHQLVMVGLQGKKIPTENLPASNLVFLVDVSGSMMDEHKLPLVKSSLTLLTDQLREEDRVAIVTYAGSAGLALSSTSGSQKQKIKDAIEELEAGGSTAGGEGIQLAYKVAKENFKKEGNNRVILCTDGDFNVGTSSDAELVKIIEEKREHGVFLTVLGYGMGNYKDNKMQQLADKGNGNHSYIDNIEEARRVLVNEFGGTLFTIASDVKLQVEFNPARVQAYRLVGYENRLLNNEDFNNDRKDAGEIGSGHNVTALYELIPAGVKSTFMESVDPLKYQQLNSLSKSSDRQEIMTIKFRYKKPGEGKSRLIEHPVARQESRNNLSDNFRFVAAVAQFGMLLTNSEFKQTSSFENARSLATTTLQNDKEGYRIEFLALLNKAGRLMKADQSIGSK